MKVVENGRALRAALERYRERKALIALVPTMGNLHEGHVALVRHARQRADCVVTTIFVNPAQFSPSEDLESYPRTLEQDLKWLLDEGCDVAYTPQIEEIYPNGAAVSTIVDVPDLGRYLCGISRPHFFRGMATVVSIMFNLVRPDLAVFGEKDFQQLLIVRRMVQDLAMGIQIDGVPIVREADGLAKSSRNLYLTDKERSIAPELYRVLTEACARLKRHALDPRRAEVEQALDEARLDLERVGLDVEYIEPRRVPSLDSIYESIDENLRLFGAVRVGTTRLIDNVPV